MRWARPVDDDLPVGLRDTRLRHLARTLHSLGERPLYEFLREIDQGAPFWPTLEGYATLTQYRSLLAADGADKLDPILFLVPPPISEAEWDALPEYSDE
jgi:hypothetical protein